MQSSSSLLGPNIPLSTLFSNTFSVVQQTKFHTHTKQYLVFIKSDTLRTGEAWDMYISEGTYEDETYQCQN
jgi:hypothetical protein